MDLKQSEVEKSLDKIEKEWTDKLNKEVKSEDEIVAIIDDISNNLFLNNKTRAVVNDKRFIIGSKVTSLPEAYVDPVTNERKQVITKAIVLIVTNEERYSLLQQQYVPAMVKADYDERYDARANIRAAVEGWVRHVTDTVKPEMLDK